MVVVKWGDARGLLLIAHPDDESMFFLPMLKEVRRQPSASLHVLCLSTGNKYGLGDVRCRELVQACSMLGISQSHVEVLDHPKLQDGMDEYWPEDVVCSVVQPYLKRWDINVVITFDGYGVSGHPNHIALYHSALALTASSPSPLTLLCLESTNLIRKYLGPLESLSHFFLHGKDDQVLTATNFNLFLAYRMMAAHASQFVWYRKLFVLFSRYGYINTMHVITSTSPTT